jgi:hypothetical protein
VRLGISLFADGAAESTKAVAMFSEALTRDFATFATHYYHGLFFALHTFYNTAIASCLSTQNRVRLQTVFPLLLAVCRDRMRVRPTGRFPDTLPRISGVPALVV